jgi:hypothetical protein
MHDELLEAINMEAARTGVYRPSPVVVPGPTAYAPDQTMHIPVGNDTVKINGQAQHYVSEAAQHHHDTSEGMRAVLYVYGFMLLMTLAVVTGWMIN